MSDLPSGWFLAPYPAGRAHADGSHGELFKSPTCDARRDFSPRDRVDDAPSQQETPGVAATISEGTRSMEDR